MIKNLEFSKRLVTLFFLIAIAMGCSKDDSITEEEEIEENSAPEINNQTFEILETVDAETTIGTVSATDSDEDGLIFSLTEDADDLFEISEEGVLNLQDGKSLDFETKTLHSVTVSVSDGSLSSTAVITIEVIDYNEEAFITTWSVGEGETVQLPLYNPTGTSDIPTEYDFSVDWGDGSTHTTVAGHDDDGASHTYSEEGQYIITITGTLVGFNFRENPASAEMIRDVSQWGSVKMGDKIGHFLNSGLETITAADAPDLSETTTLGSMFSNTAFNGEIGHWDVSNITHMNVMFANASNFNGDISGWDVSNVEDMGFMFTNATSFNQDISEWDVGMVTDMFRMFYGATNFNQDLTNWNTINVTDCGEFNSNGSGLESSNRPQLGCFGPS